jgi:hypothetical protein
MIKEKTKYDRIVDILRKSKPIFNEADAVSEKVIRQIQEEKSVVKFSDLILEFFFGWIYIVWVRRSMVAAAFVIIVFFGYQQAVIINRINELSDKKVYNGTLLISDTRDNLKDYLMLNRIDVKKFRNKRIEVSKKEIDQLIKSVNKLQVKYKDIIDLIENDPQLRKYVEEKMNQDLKR